MSEKNAQEVKSPRGKGSKKSQKHELTPPELDYDRQMSVESQATVSSAESGSVTDLNDWQQNLMADKENTVEFVVSIILWPTIIVCCTQ